MAHQEEKLNLFQIIKANWFLVLFIGGVIIGWTTIQLETKANTNSILDINNRIQKNETMTAAANVQLSAQLGQIQTDLQWIKAKLK